MVTQRIMCISDGKPVFSKRNYKFVTALDLSKFKQVNLLTCVPISELPPNIPTPMSDANYLSMCISYHRQ